MTDDIRAIKNKYLNSNNEKTDSLITNIGENETALSEEITLLFLKTQL